MKTKSENTKINIITSAIDCFYKNGFEETTFAQISKAAKLTQPALYNYFENKMSLLQECCVFAANYGREYIDQNINPNTSAEDRLDQYISANFSFFTKESKWAYMIASVYFFSQNNPAIKEIFNLIALKSAERLKTVIIHYLHEKKIKPQIADEAIELIHSLLIGELYKAMYAKKKNQSQVHLERTLKFVKTMINK